MTSIEKASAKVNELVNGGMELNEAIRKASVEFGVPEETLLIEWDFQLTTLFFCGILGAMLFMPVVCLICTLLDFRRRDNEFGQ